MTATPLPKAGCVALGLGSRLQWSNEELIRMAQAAENLGYEAIYVAESWGRDQITLLTMIALNTTRIRLGTGIAGIWARTPALMAQTATSLDSISNGRFIVGLGPGNPLPVQHWQGLPFERPVARLREFVDIMHMAWDGKPLEYNGDYFKPGGLYRLAYKGPRARVPIYIAAIGPNMIELAGEVGDGWMPVHVDVTQLHTLKEHLERGARRAGRDPDAIEIVASFVACVDDDEEWARLQAKGRLGWYIGRGYRYQDLMRRFGFGKEAERIKSAWEQGGLEAASAAVTDEIVDRMAIAGTAENCRQQITRCFAAGIHAVKLDFHENIPFEAAYRSVEHLAPR